MKKVPLQSMVSTDLKRSYICPFDHLEQTHHLKQVTVSWSYFKVVLS